MAYEFKYKLGEWDKTKEKELHATLAFAAVCDISLN